MPRKTRIAADEEKKIANVVAPAKATRKKIVKAEAAPAPEVVPGRKSRKVPEKKTADPAKVPEGKTTRKRSAKTVAEADKKAQPKSPIKAADPQAIRLFKIHDPEIPVSVQDREFELVKLRQDPGHQPLLAALRILSADAELKKAALWGLLSADVVRKTGLSASELRGELSANPGYDIYFIHPYPELEALYHNPWLQAESGHPGFADLMRHFMGAIGLPADSIDAITHSSLFTIGHLIVAKPAFWADYLAFADLIFARAKEKLDSETKSRLFDEIPPEGKLSVLFLISMRLLGLFLMRKGCEWKAHKIILTAKEQKLNAHLRLLRELKDNALALRSPWLIACWDNYRALYLAQTMGQEWIARNTAALKPRQMRMAIPAGQIVYNYPRTGKPL